MRRQRRSKYPSRPRHRLSHDLRLVARGRLEFGPGNAAAVTGPVSGQLASAPCDRRFLWRELGNTGTEAALAFAAACQDEDAAILLLQDIRDIFGALGADRPPSQTLVDRLNAIDDRQWSEAGPRGQPAATQANAKRLARSSAPFQISPQTIRLPSQPFHQRISDKPTIKGYYRSQFETAWRSYCDDLTPSHTGNLRHLPTG